jgi:lipopolysaccharide/colanic/teichoic acid biosynthesis glycosyltransferase
LPWRRPRRQLFFCALLDLAGLPLVVALADWLRPLAEFQSHPEWLLQLGWIYLLVGWLFGNYTVLRWPGLRLGLLLKRLALTAAGSALAVVLLGWLFNAPEEITLLERGNLLVLLACQSLWSLAVRLVLRLSGVAPGAADPLPLMASSGTQARLIAREWLRSPHARRPQLISPSTLGQERQRRNRLRQLTLAPGLVLEPAQQRQLEQLTRRGVSLTTFEQMVGIQLERLPPALLPHQWLEYADLPWSDEFGFQRKLKRVADVAVAVVLLVLSAPVLLLAALAIRLEDGGPVFYVQQRSGWMGRPFRLYKLRTMQHQPSAGPACWTVPGDQRITRLGRLLRPTRLDELPQLLNVLRGEMSLIGPRPERPELEAQLEAAIPHYRKRHWMLPGLSGWAQVCAPYAASVEEAELKLSYDLYYLRHWSTALDLLILAKTIKTVLKGAGR